MKTKVMIELVGAVVGYFVIGHIARRMFGHQVMTPTVLVSMIIGIVISNCYAYSRQARRRASRFSD